MTRQAGDSLSDGQVASADSEQHSIADGDFLSEPKGTGFDDAPTDPELTLEMAYNWLKRVRPAAVIAILREPEAAYVSARIFQGFRINAQSYSNPIVRSRLARQLLIDDILRERINALVIQAEECDPEPHSAGLASPPIASSKSDDSIAEGLLSPYSVYSPRQDRTLMKNVHDRQAAGDPRCSPRPTPLPPSETEEEASDSVPEGLDGDSSNLFTTGPEAVDERLSRQERKRLRQEAKAQMEHLREATRATERRLSKTEDALQSVTKERDELRRTSEQAALRVARFERRNIRLTSERDALLKALTEQTGEHKIDRSRAGHLAGDVATDQDTDMDAPQIRVSREREGFPSRVTMASGGLPAHGSGANQTIRTASPFEEAAFRLLGRGSSDTALAIAEDVLRIEPKNVTALEIAVECHRQQGNRTAALTAARDLTLAALEQSDLRRATEALAGMLSVDPDSTLVPTATRPYIATLKGSAAEIGRIAPLFARLRGANPGVHRRLTQLINEHLPPNLAAAILASDTPLGIGDPLPLNVSPPITAIALIAAIDAGSAQTVDAVRDALAALRQKGGLAYQQTLSAISQAADGDESYLRPVQRGTRGPVLVDASNVAWYDDARGISDRPRLAPLLLVRTTLRTRGYFPIYLLGDAPLPHTIDDRERLRRMLQRDEITVVSPGTDADEVLLREARRLGAPIVTNDYMADWDPGGEVEKIRYTIPSSGPAYLLS